MEGVFIAIIASMTQTQKSWQDTLAPYKANPSFKEVVSFTLKERQTKNIFPPKELLFNAFKLTPLEKVKVVILGQDPYHGKGQAMGLSFSVPEGMRQPPSLKNIFKEIEADTGKKAPKSGDLTYLATQGVLLLNAVLTVEEGMAASHQNKGWEDFTDFVIKQVSEHTEHTVFLLWGSFAQKKESLIDRNKHTILKSVHPSPLSAHRGFLGCKHFTKANEALKAHGQEGIYWTGTSK